MQCKAKRSFWRQNSHAVVAKNSIQILNKVNYTCTSTLSSACHKQTSSSKFKGSRFLLSSPLNRKGSCGMIDMAALELLRFSREMSWPSTRILPCGSGRRNKAAKREDFPAPVCPTMPTCKEFECYIWRLETVWKFRIEFWFSDIFIFLIGQPQKYPPN